MELRPRRLGEYLQETCGVSGYQVFRGLQEQMRLQSKGKYKPLGQLLIQLGLASEGQVDEALERQSQDLIELYSKTPIALGARATNATARPQTQRPPQQSAPQQPATPPAD